MLDRVRYFQAIVKYHSFTEAAEECHISQSAISQQIASLENELGVKLLNREKRKFSLTPAGQYFYNRTLGLVDDYDHIVKETERIAANDHGLLRIGCILTYGGEELQLAIAEFNRKYPDVEIRIETGTHEELYNYLRLEGIDILLSDQRRKFNQTAVNCVLKEHNVMIEIAKTDPLSQKEHLDADDLKNHTVIVVTSDSQKDDEIEYYKQVYGFKGDFITAHSIKDARLMVVSKRGVLPVDGNPIMSHFSATIARVPYYYGGAPLDRNLCVFWKKDNSGYYIEEFADILKAKFKEESLKEEN